MSIVGKQPNMDEKLRGAADIKGSGMTEHENHVTVSPLHSSSDRSSKSLGRVINVHTFTGGFSSDEDSDFEREGSNVVKGMSRSLGRNEMNALFRSSAAGNVVPVSERSAAYRDMITSSNNTRKSSNQSPRHSAVNLSNGADTSPIRSRIESNPFFQLDRQGKLPDVSDERRKTSPAKMSKVRKSTTESSLVHTKSESPSIIGMSVQMRIKIWTEKEKEADKQVVATNRRSLQPSSLFSVHSNPANTSAGNNDREDITAHSDDEAIKSKMSTSVHPIRENFYEEIDDKVARDEIKEASSSSESSPNVSPSKTAVTVSSGKSSKKSEMESKKKVKGGSSTKPKTSKWKLRSPLSKRKQKVDNSPLVEEGKEDGDEVKRPLESNRDEEDIPDDVFSPTTPGKAKKSLEQKNNRISSHTEELPSVFNKVDSSTPSTTRENRSISREIRDIIDSFGTVEEKYTTKFVPHDQTVSISITEGSGSEKNYDSDSEDEDSDEKIIQSSLDVDSIARQALKRRASDSYRTQLGIKDIHVKGRKGSVSPFEENTEGVVATALMYADAVWDRDALDGDELSFRVGDVIEILDMTDDVWWHGSIGETSGWFPASFVRIRVGQDSDGEENDLSHSTKSLTPSTVNTKSGESACLVDPESLIRHSDPTPPGSSEPDETSDKVAATLPRTFPRRQGGTTRRRMTIRRKDPSSSSLPQKLTPDQVRAKIIEEIVSTERDYVKHLEDIIEGYLKRCREYNKLFDEEQIDIIFSNIEQVYKFQRDFLGELESKIRSDHIEQSEIGEVFTNNQHEFKVYSQYCNNHPHAVNEMSSLQEIEQYSFFFESCRLLRNLQDISLEGFLLTPVQKICKYPLQLSELLKYTDETHPDHPHIVAAQKAMKDVAMLINEQKRRIENMGKIGCWQRTIEGWKGPDILESSTELIHCGELHKISKGHSQERHFFLFDRQLVYCKKDAIGGKLGYKGRVDLDSCQIADMADSSVLHGSTAIKNCWRMNNKAKDNKWYVIYAKSPQVKEEWMSAFKRERERVKEDEEKGFYVSLKMKNAAVSLCANNAETRKRGKSVKKHVAFNDSVEGSSIGNRKLAATMSGSSSYSQSNKKSRTAKRKVNSVSGATSSKVIF